MPADIENEIENEVENEENDELETAQLDEEVDAVDEEQQDADRETQEAVEKAEGEGVGETVITIGDAEPEDEELNKAPEWVRDLRKRTRDLEKENRELRRQQQLAEQPDAIVIGKRPAMDDPDIDYDTEKYEQKLAEYFERKRQADAQAEQLEQQKQREIDQWNERVALYREEVVKLGIPDYDEAEDTVMTVLSDTQQGMIIHGAKNPAMLVAALGKNPEKLRELAALEGDPVRFSMAIGHLEAQLKVSKRSRTPPPPEKPVRGSGPISAATDNTLERLRDKAAKTGDFTEVNRYKRQLREKGKK